MTKEKTYHHSHRNRSLKPKLRFAKVIRMVNTEIEKETENKMPDEKGPTTNATACYRQPSIKRQQQRKEDPKKDRLLVVLSYDTAILPASTPAKVPTPGHPQSRTTNPAYPSSTKSSPPHLPTSDMSTKPHLPKTPLLLYLSDLSLKPRRLDPLSDISTCRHMQITSTLTPLH